MFALRVLPVVVLAIITSCAENELVKEEERATQAFENSLGMKFVPVNMPAARQQGEESVFYLQESEVTYEQYRTFKVATGLATTAAEKIPSGAPLHPHDFDHWTVATEFAERLSQWDEENDYRLPTEREWEFACTGRIGGEAVVTTVCENGGPANRSTRQLKPNRLGLHDMLGVYGEYCSDRYNSENDPSLATIAEGPDAKVVRGMRQRTDEIGCYRYSSDYRFPVAVQGQTPTLVIGVRLVAQPTK